MLSIFNLFMPIITRLFNKFTPVGVVAILVGVILEFLGFSDDIVKWSMEQDYTPVVAFILSMLKFLTNHPVILSITGIFITSIGGFYLWRRDYQINKLSHLENKLKELNLIKQINILEREIQDDFNKNNKN